MTDSQVSALIQEFRVPLHVRRHCAAVANFAVELGKKFIAAGEPINLTLLRHGALLHDMLRVVDFRRFEPEKFPDPATLEDIKFWEMLRKKYSGRGHEDVAAEILESRGFHDVAQLIRMHRFAQVMKGFDTWEEKLLYYADKRAMHDKIVLLQERLEDGRKRNMPDGEAEKESRKIEEKVYELEKELALVIGEQI